MRFCFLASIILVLSPVRGEAQFTYSLDQSIPVEINERTLNFPWAGGFNASQFNSMDLNADGSIDLVVYDRTANVLQLFLNEGDHYTHAPEYVPFFPETISSWLLLRDFNCDGKKDIFTSDPFGIRVFQNVTNTGENLAWQDLGYLLTKGLSPGKINLKVNPEDIPVIDDIDNDGDLDILNVRFVGIGTIEWHKNLSMEQNGNCNALEFERVTQTYGGVQECSCGVFAFGSEPCPTSNGRTEHAGGKAMLTIDMDGDGDKDLLFSEESCQVLFYLENEGSVSEPQFTYASPFTSEMPAILVNHPAAFLEDVDFDGLSDIVVSPNLNARTNLNINFQSSTWLYKNTGSASIPEFSFVERDFFQNEMIDVGDYSVPVFFDYDQDGDQDMFIGLYAGSGFFGSIIHFENVGTVSAPSFRFVTDDFQGLKIAQSAGLIPRMYNIKPQFIDMDDDGNTDLAFTATNLQNSLTSLRYLQGGEGSLSFLPGLINTNFNIGLTENLLLEDVNQDGTLDILVGKSNGALYYYRNGGMTGSFNNLSLETDSFLGLGQSFLRRDLAIAIGDLDADGRQDLVTGDQRGSLAIYGDYRFFHPDLQPATQIVYNDIKKDYTSFNLGGRAHPFIVNLFNTDKPAIAVGNTLGGIRILRNDGGRERPPEPIVSISPTPWRLGTEPSLVIKSDRNVLVQIFSMMGQKMTESFFVPANQEYPLPIHTISSGMYIARFTSEGKVYARRFIVL